MNFKNFITSSQPQIDYKKILIGLVIAALAIGFFARTFHIALPQAQVFDEVYFPVFSNDFLSGKLAFDAHPTLGKLLMAPGIYLFGNQPYGWRIVVSLFGLLTIALVWWQNRKNKVEQTENLILTFLIAIDCMLVTYSRVGLIDGIMIFFILLAYFVGLRSKTLWQYIVVGILIGLAVSVKWIALGVVAPIGYVAFRKNKLPEFGAGLVAAAGIYLGIEVFARVLTHSQHIWADIREWNWQAWNYHKNLTATHPWSSEWWTWPLMLRPVLMYYQEVPPGSHIVETITNLGNPFVWWSATFSVVLSIGHLIRLAASKEKQSILLVVGFIFLIGALMNAMVVKNMNGALLVVLALAAFGTYLIEGKQAEGESVFDHPLMPMLVGYFAFYVPWMFIGRVVFLYHYLPCLIFSLFTLAWWLRQLYSSRPKLCVTFLTIALLLSIFYLPLNMGMPLPQKLLDAHFLIKGWL